LGRAHAVSGDVQNVIDPTGYPVVTVLVAPAPVAGEILAFVGGKISLDESLVIPVHSAHLAGPGIDDAEISFTDSFHDVAVVVDDLRLYPEQRTGCGT